MPGTPFTAPCPTANPGTPTTSEGINSPTVFSQAVADNPCLAASLSASIPLYTSYPKAPVRAISVTAGTAETAFCANALAALWAATSLALPCSNRAAIFDPAPMAARPKPNGSAIVSADFIASGSVAVSIAIRVNFSLEPASLNDLCAGVISLASLPSSSAFLLSSSLQDVWCSKNLLFFPFVTISGFVSLPVSFI